MQRDPPVFLKRESQDESHFDVLCADRLLMNKQTAHWTWLTCSLLLFIPFTAILHHAVFYRNTCMLRYFGYDYNLPALMKWLSNDPSPYLAAMLTPVAYGAGKKYPVLRPWALAFLIGFSPLALWIWDIPFSGRVVCRHLHDGRSGMHSWYLYMLGAVLTLLLPWAVDFLKPSSRRMETKEPPT